MSAYALLLSTWQRLFCRRRLYRWNRLLFHLSLRGMGVLNHESMDLSGEREILRRLARLGGNPTVLDVGAHDGEWSRELLRLVPGAQVFSFEPHPETFARLQQKTAGYVPVHAAVAERQGTVTLFDYAGAASAGSQHASLVAGTIEQVHRAPARRWSVPAITIDEFLRERGIRRVHLLKIDTEGSEMGVLRGARGALAKGAVDLIQLEFNAPNVLGRWFMRDFRELLAAYRPFRLLPDGPVPLGAYDPAVEEIFAFQNVLFVADRLAAEQREVMTA